MTTIVLVDDHQVVRQGLRALLEIEPDFHLVGEAADGLEAVRIVEDLRPQVAVLDLMMPSLNGLEATRQIKQRVPETQVIILSMHANEAYVLEALKNGASGYVLKESSAAELVTAVRETVAGRRYLSPPLSERAIEAYIRRAHDTTIDPYDTLTTREREVLQMAAEGLTNGEIADRLSISPRTVETHRANMMRKLDVNSQTELVLFAVRRGIIVVEE